MNIDERMQMLQVNIESLHSNIAQLVEAGQATDQRIDKLTIRLDQVHRDVELLTGHMTTLNTTMDRLDLIDDNRQ